MKRYNPRLVSIARLAALALSALSFLPSRVSAHEVTGYVVMFPSVGLASGERLRLTLFNRDGTPVRAQARIHHSGGVMVGMADGSVRAHALRSFDFYRGDIPLPGEAGTGRLQLQASCYISIAEPQTANEGLSVSLETISISDGTSNTILFAEVNTGTAGGGARDILVGGDDRDVLMGIVPTQRLRVTFFNPLPSGLETSPETHSTHTHPTGHVKIFDGSGALIVQSNELVIPPGEFRSFDFPPELLSFSPGPGTNRQQVRIKPFFEFGSERLSPILATFELVDNITGKTEVLAGHQCLVFFLGGMEESE
jgi:prepilin-type processing-associated H-X9-DG protein